ncbi:hypothetical protein KIN20_018316 [Parelaphostrongylus tenuis]|uniref:Uncharacterized protein n=1 Tax=Parelaphostrongylus tenuis TaxID=148309 RepID=A0AAD5MPN7_PARTN|nr:hypothetical protein KIN20_018316 [Parelaphostrongylus tenuis]
MPLAAEHRTIRGTVSTTNIIMANWVDPNVTECDEQNESLESRNVWKQLEGWELSSKRSFNHLVYSRKHSEYPVAKKH